MSDTRVMHNLGELEALADMGPIAERQHIPAPKQGTVDYAEWLADKLHNGGDFGKEAATLLVEQAKALNYYRAGLEQRAPRWVPARVMLTRTVRGDGPFSRSHAAEPNVYTAECNPWGAVAVRSRSDAPLLGLKPAEFEVVAWRLNDPTKEQTHGR